jgi:ABC-type transport system involved in cytochrome bd biosynthesis fused ATPase/permease subunit
MRRRWCVPSVVATSAMDCGPAALQALAAGMGLRIDYGALREACATDIDGTSIDRLETVGRELGLRVVQRLVPTDWLWLQSARCLPAIVVTRVAEGATHFVVVWRTLGNRVQVMDPAVGRLWVQRRRFERDLYRHAMEVPEPAWRKWVESGDFRATLDERRHRLGLSRDRSSGMPPAHDDAALRFGVALVEAGLVTVDRIGAVLEACATHPESIPPEYWLGRPRASGASPAEGESTVRIEGVIVLACDGVDSAPGVEGERSRRREVSNAPPSHAHWLRALSNGLPLEHVRAGLLAAACLGTALALEPLLARAAIAMLPMLSDALDRRTAAFSMLMFWGVVGWARWSLEGHARSFGRALHDRLRSGFMEAVDRLDDRYFRTRLLTDLALRAIGAHRVRALSLQVAGMAVSIVALVALAILTVAVAPAAWIWLAFMVVFALLAPLWAASLLKEPEHRMRQSSAIMVRAAREALLGHAALRSMQASNAMFAGCQDHERRWRTESHARDRIVRRIDTLVAAGLMLSAPAIVHQCVRHGAAPGTALLVAIMLAAIAGIARDWVLACCALPWSIEALRKACDPLSEAVAARTSTNAGSASAVPDGALAVSFRKISVREGDREVLAGIDLDVRAGEHVAVVGESGSGKSTLLELLSGAARPAEGVLQIAGRTLEGDWVREVNRRTAWFDGSAYLFDRSCRWNLEFGPGGRDPAALVEALADVDLLESLATRSLGLDSRTHDVDRPLSDSELRRLQIARSLRYLAAGLVIADEPTRGLDQRNRQRITESFRRRFRNATLFFATHDLDAASRFDRVVVMREGLLVESGHPARLADDPGSAFSRLCAARIASGPARCMHVNWRGLRQVGGRLRDDPSCHG